MSDIQLTTDPGYQALVDRISAVYAEGQRQAFRAVNEQLTRTFWQIGHDIVQFEQGGRTRLFYVTYPKGATLSHLLSWSHDVELLKLDDIGQMNLYLGYFAAEEKYQLFLPNREEQRSQLQAALQQAAEQDPLQNPAP